MRNTGRPGESRGRASSAAAQPREVDAQLRKAVALHRQGRLGEAEASYREIVARAPRHHVALHMLGVIATQRHRGEEAVRLIDQSLAIEPHSAVALYNRGNALKGLGRLDDALASYDKALSIEPRHVGALGNRGGVLRDLKRLDEAVASYDKAVAIDPGNLQALNGRGVVLKELRRLDEAVACYDKALSLKPDYADALSNRGNALMKLRRIAEALEDFDKALVLRPDHVPALTNRGHALNDLGRNDEAVASYERALALKPDDAELRIAGCMANLPILYGDEREIVDRRAAYRRSLDALRDAALRPEIARNLADGIGTHQPFYLAYQGQNDRDLQASYGALACRLMAERYPAAALPGPPAPGEKIRVGIVSGFFRTHSNWKVPIKGWLGQLDRRRFRLLAYHTGKKTDAETRIAAALSDRFVQGPLSVDEWRRAILADAPHVLLYPEIGMDTVAAKLAAQRLAPVQCNSWGHPDTSGFPTLDYYLSSAAMEPDDGEGHYTERLVRLPNLSIYCEPLDPPRIALDRAELGMRPGATVFWCGQSLFKYLPQYDPVFPRIARQVPGCQFAFIRHHLSDRVTDAFRARLDRSFASFGLNAQDHCLFLPRLDEPRFVAATGQCDVVLDSIGWSGCNSTLESLHHDLPIVTMPGPLMRGRHTMAILARMGITDTIAADTDEYVAIAARLAHDASWRGAVRRRIAENKHRLYRDRSAIAALEEFLDRVAREDRTPGHGR